MTDFRSENDLRFRVPDGCELVALDERHADDALAMLRAILAELAAEGRPEYYCMRETDDEFRGYYADPDFVTLGVVRQDRLIACGTASFRRSETELFAPRLPENVPFEKIGYVEYIQVVKSERGQGIQPALFHALEKELVKRGAEYFTGLVSPHNAASFGNFVKGGYREIGRIVMSNGFERLLMAKKAGFRH